MQVASGSMELPSGMGMEKLRDMKGWMWQHVKFILIDFQSSLKLVVESGILKWIKFEKYEANSYTYELNNKWIMRWQILIKYLNNFIYSEDKYLQQTNFNNLFINLKCL